MYHVQRRGVIDMEHVGRAGKQRSAPMVTAKIGGPTGIEGLEGFRYLRTRMWGRLAPCFAYLGNLVAIA